MITCAGTIRCMSSRAEHHRAGIVAGALVGLVATIVKGLDREPMDLVIGALGGGLGGVFGARIPDLLEPPTSPDHRGVVHGVAFNAAVLAKLAPSAAAASRDLVAGAEDPFDRKLRLLVGSALVGTTAGHLSHIALDATTPRGLPLLTKKF